MSLRPQIYGFSLKEVQSLFASADEKALEQINNNYEQILTELFSIEPEEQENLRKEGKAVIHRSVMEGAPFADLDCENEVHVFVAEVIVRYTNLKPIEDTGEWKMDAFWDLQSACASKVGSEIADLLAIFEQGRSFFGKKIESGWAYYGYLTLEETEKLLGAINEPAKFEVPDYLSEFVAELISWLEEIISEKLDFWFIAS
jgi:hypothetical protein